MTNVQTVFLDRDGVINVKAIEGEYVDSLDKFHVLPGVQQVIAALNRAQVRVIVVSNQRGIALGLYTAADVKAIHETLQCDLANEGAHIDRFYFCPHDKNACECRKPSPGMFLAAQKDFPEITAQSSVMIGDSLSDIRFGQRLGMRTVFVRGLVETRKCGAEEAEWLADYVCGSLPEAVGLLQQYELLVR